MTHKKPILSIIVAYAQNRTIGKDNKLPWHLSNDLKRFKKITTGHSLIMGKNTLFSLPAGPLPNRRNIVLSTSLTDCFNGKCEIARSVEEVLKMIEDEQEVFVIGGSKVFELFLPIANKLYLTLIEKNIEGDTFLPLINFSQWELREKEIISDDPQTDFVYRYETWVRKHAK